MVTICSLFLFHAVLFSLHATKLLGHHVGNCPLRKDHSEDTWCWQGCLWAAQGCLEGQWGEEGRASRVRCGSSTGKAGCQCFANSVQVYVTPALQWDKSTCKHDVSAFPACCFRWCWAIGNGGDSLEGLPGLAQPSHRTCLPGAGTGWGSGGKYRWLWGQDNHFRNSPVPSPLAPWLLQGQQEAQLPTFLHLEHAFLLLLPFRWRKKPVTGPLSTGEWHPISPTLLGVSCDYVDLLSFTGWKL